MSAIADTLYRSERAAPIIPSPNAVSAGDIDFFHENGYLAVDGVLSPEEVTTARTALTDLIHGRIAGTSELLQPEPDQKAVWPTLSLDERADHIRKVWRFAQYEPRLKALGDTQPAIQNLLQRLLGESCRMIQDMALLKPPFIGTEKPWHQDAAYFGWGPPERLMGIWIALDPATAENGCMHVIPGTHREGPVPHVHARDCQIPDARVQVERDVIVPLTPGGALFFSALLHHGTPPNSSPNRRWALQYHYAAQSAVPINRREHAEMFFEGDRYAGCRAKSILLDELEP